MKKRILSIVLCIAVILGMGCDMKKIEVEQSEEKFRFAAYMTPPPANVGLSTDSNNPNYITDESYKTMADCGFNYAYSIYENNVEQVLQALDLCEKYNITYLARDNFGINSIEGIIANSRKDLTLSDKEKADIKLKVDQYKTKKAYGGVFAYDEPSSILFDKINMVSNFYKTEYPSYEYNVNLLPTYANKNQLGNDSYKEHLKQFVEKTKPSQLSYDNYPLLKDPYGGISLGTDYLLNLDLVAKQAKETKIPYYVFLLTIGHGAGRQYRTPNNYADIAWQVYSSMAYGARGAQTFTYWTTLSGDLDPSVTYAVVDKNGKPTPVYYSLQSVIKEVRAMEKYYMAFKYDGTMLFNANKSNPNPAFEIIAEKMQNHNKISSVICSQDVIIGAFKDKNENDAFMLTNYTDPGLKLSSEVTIKFKNVKKIKVCKKGREEEITLKNGAYKTTLGSGEGQFIIPIF